MTLEGRKRFMVLERDQFKCTYCGRTPADGVQLQVDHVMPRAAGGPDDLTNLVAACARCNHGKSNLAIDPASIGCCGFEHGRITERQRIRDMFLYRTEHGFESIYDVMAALWPETEW